MKEYKHSIYIGRFQPFHNGHLQVLQKALEISETVLILIGSYKAASNIKNPLTYEERVDMIKYLLDDTVEIVDHTTGTITKKSSDILNRVKFIPVRDYYNNDTFWATEVQHKVSEYVSEGETVALMGFYKDSSSYYLNMFPQWETVLVEKPDLMNATDVRNSFYQRHGLIPEYNPYHRFWASDTANYDATLVPPKIDMWLKHSYFNTQKYHEHIQEYRFIQEYKKKWANAPFPPIFTTTDCVVVCSGHVLVIERGFNPGKGLHALPGGFLRPNETLKNGALRELKEETGIAVDKIILQNSIVDEKVFDYPGRSLRGRTITHAYYIKLKDGQLPKIKAGDDASKVKWMSLNDVSALEDKFFEDHAHIINYFIRRQ